MQIPLSFQSWALCIWMDNVIKTHNGKLNCLRRKADWKGEVSFTVRPKKKTKKEGMMKVRKQGDRTIKFSRKRKKREYKENIIKRWEWQRKKDKGGRGMWSRMWIHQYGHRHCRKDTGASCHANKGRAAASYAFVHRRPKKWWVTFKGNQTWEENNSMILREKKLICVSLFSFTLTFLGWLK